MNALEEALCKLLVEGAEWKAKCDAIMGEAYPPVPIEEEPTIGMDAHMASYKLVDEEGEVYPQPEYGYWASDRVLFGVSAGGNIMEFPKWTRFHWDEVHETCIYLEYEIPNPKYAEDKSPGSWAMINSDDPDL